MQITPVSNNNTNFKQLVVSKNTLRGLNCTRDDILKNEFIKKWSEVYDVCISGKNGSLFSKPTEFALAIGDKVKNKLFSNKTTFEYNELCPDTNFNGLSELDKITDSIKPDFYEKHIKISYNREIDAIRRAGNGYPYYFLIMIEGLMRQIAGFSSKEECKELNKYCVEGLKKLNFWKPLMDNPEKAPLFDKNYWKSQNIDMKKSVPLIALENNNLKLLEFLKSKGENMNECLDFIKQGEVSKEAREILKDVKYQDKKIFQLEECFDSAYLRNIFFKENADIDINSRNEDGDTLVTKAFKEGNLNFLEYLKNVEGIDWNAYDTNGQNAAKIILSDNNSNNTENLLEFLTTVEDKGFNINSPGVIDYFRTAHFTGRDNCIVTPLINAIKNKPQLIKPLLKFKKIDIKNALDNPTTLPIQSKLFGLLIRHPNFTYFDDEFLKHVSKYPEYTQEITKSMPQITMNKALKIYNNSGEITLDEMDTIVSSLQKYKAEESITNTQINSIEEGLGHLLCDIQIDTNDFNSMCKMSKIITTLDTLGYNFKSKNILGQTPLGKAIEGENTGVAKLILEHNPELRFAKDAHDAIHNCMLYSNNQELMKLFEGGA